MKRLFPGSGEVALFAGVAVVCAVIVSRFPAWDIGLAVLAMPLFVFACVLGLRKNGHLTRQTVPVRVESADESV